jgi:ankyrin repeat protein
MRECDPCCQDIDGYTAAHYAAERDDVEMLKALTTRFYSEIKLFSNEKIITIHERCLKALSIRQKHGLTVFMLCCQYQSIKCLNYLFELQINDANLQVKYLIKYFIFSFSF